MSSPNDRSFFRRGIVKLVGLGCWGGASLFVFVCGIFLVTSPEKLFQLPIFLEKTLNYALYAALPEGGAVLGSFVNAEDARAAILTDYLRYQRSPMVVNGLDFVQAADRYNLPWTLLPAIAGKESGFGKATPRDSYNPFGWGVFTGQQTGVNFASWRDAIFTVAQGLREKYFDRGLNTPALIEPYYTPSSPERGHPWLLDVTYFTEEIGNWR